MHIHGSVCLLVNIRFRQNINTHINNKRKFNFIFIHYCRRCPYLFYLLTVGVEVVYFHLITLRNTPPSVGLLWTRDRPVAETST
jgi:hypothetical protein